MVASLKQASVVVAFVMAAAVFPAQCIASMAGPDTSTPVWPSQFSSQAIFSYKDPSGVPTTELQTIFYDYLAPHQMQRVESHKVASNDKRVPHQTNAGNNITTIYNYAGGPSYRIDEVRSICEVIKPPEAGNYPPSWLASASYNGTDRVKGLAHVWLTERNSVYYEGYINKIPLRIVGDNYAIDFHDFKARKLEDSLFDPCTGHPGLYCVDEQQHVKKICPRGEKMNQPPPPPKVDHSYWMASAPSCASCCQACVSPDTSSPVFQSCGCKPGEVYDGCSCDSANSNDSSTSAEAQSQTPTTVAISS